MIKPPVAVYIETTTRCGARCIMCPHGSLERKNRDMPTGEVLRLVKESADIGTQFIFYHFYGETTMHPEFVQITDEIGLMGLKSPVLLYTNGINLFKNVIVDSILRNLFEVRVSINGHNAETMKLVVPGLDPSITEKGIVNLWNRRRESKRVRPIITIRTISNYIGYNKELFDTKWKPYCDQIAYMPYVDFNYSDVRLPPRKSLPCPQLWEYMPVTINGNVLMCCADFHEKFPIGNVRDAGLAEIWNGDRINHYRELHLANRSHEIPICAVCTDYHYGTKL